MAPMYRAKLAGTCRIATGVRENSLAQDDSTTASCCLHPRDALIRPWHRMYHAESLHLRHLVHVTTVVRPSGRRILPCDVRWSTRTKCAPAPNRWSQFAMGRAAGFAWCRPTTSWWAPFVQCHTVAQATKFSRGAAASDCPPGPRPGGAQRGSRKRDCRRPLREPASKGQPLAAALRERQWQTSVQSRPLFGSQAEPWHRGKHVIRSRRRSLYHALRFQAGVDPRGALNAERLSIRA